MSYLFLCKGELIYWVPHVTEMKLLTVLIHTSSVKNENRKIMNTLIIDKCSSLIEDISLFL